MAHLWVQDEGGSWAVVELDEVETPSLVLAAGGLLPTAAEVPGNDAGHVLMLRYQWDMTKEWALVGFDDAVRVNGLSLHLGIHVLEDRDAVSFLDGRIVFLSKEGRPRVVPFPGSRKPKALVQAKRLERIGALDVQAFCEDVSNVPLGLLRAHVIVACVDSRLARLHINQAAWRLGVPWIDAGVGADELVVRMCVYVPGGGPSCLECAWSKAHYDAVEHRYPCLKRGPLSAPTNAPSSLGALAASLQSIEVDNILRGNWAAVPVSRQVLLDARHHRQVVTNLPLNSACKFDHETWRVQEVPVAPNGMTAGWRSISCRIPAGLKAASTRLSSRGNDSPETSLA